MGRSFRNPRVDDVICCSSSMLGGTSASKPAAVVVLTTVCAVGVVAITCRNRRISCAAIFE